MVYVPHFLLFGGWAPPLTRRAENQAEHALMEVYGMNPHSSSHIPCTPVGCLATPKTNTAISFLKMLLSQN